MELVQELFISASLALVLSFLVAKLVSMAMVNDENHEVEMNLGIFGEKLAVQGIGSERKVESVEQSAETIDKFVGGPFEVDQTVETVRFLGDFEEKQCELPDISSSDGLGENFEINVLPNNVLEGSGMNEIVNENSHNSNPEGYKEANVDDIVDQRLDNAIAEVIEEKTANNIVKSTTEEADIEEDDDDWEGIERTELENVFAAASRYVAEEDCLENAGNELEMEFYGLLKVATEGPCRKPQPMALKVSARAKWNAWQRLGSMSPEVAMEKYVTLLSNRAPGWMEHYSTVGCSKSESLYTGEGDYMLHQPDFVNGSKLQELNSCGQRGVIAPNYDQGSKGKE